MRYTFIFVLVAVLQAILPSKADVLTNGLSRHERLRLRVDALWAQKSPDRLDEFVEGARMIQRDFPDEEDGYHLMMAAIENYRFFKSIDKARAVAKEMAEGSGPDRFKAWARGSLNRMDALGKPVRFQFTAVDGREVDSEKLKGKVVLVDFWATGCGPCVAELPRVKAIFEKFRGRGFEVIGISCDTDKDRLQQLVKERGISWPQYFDGKQQTDNRFAREFGINGIPTMFLIDREARLRFDDVRAADGLEEQIAKLLAEP